MNKKKSLIIILVSFIAIVCMLLLAVVILKPPLFYDMRARITKLRGLSNIANVATLEIKNDNPNLFLALASEKKFKEMQQFYPNLFQQSGFNKVVLHLTTDPEQFLKSKWGTGNEVFSGLTTSSAQGTVTIELFLDAHMFKQRGYSEKKVAEFLESRFIYALKNEEIRLFPVLQTDPDPYYAQKIVTENTKSVESKLKEVDDSQLFLASYK